MNYQDFVVRIAQQLDMMLTDFDFATAVPAMIDYAEGRCYRELDLLSVRVRDSSATSLSNTRTFTLPLPGGNSFITVESVSVVTPAGATVSSGTRTQLARIQKRFSDFLYPTETASSALQTPTTWANFNKTSILLGPPPGDAFVIEIVGTIQPTALSPTNPTTFLTEQYPDLFVAAAMIYATVSNGQVNTLWEAQYKLLLESASAQEGREKFSVAMSRGVAA